MHTDIVRRIANSLADRGDQIDGQSDRIDPRNESEWRRLSVRQSAVVSGLDKHPQRRLNEINERIGEKLGVGESTEFTKRL